jgi:hypothetical protein
MKYRNLVRIADLKEYLPMLDREEITHSRLAEILTEKANLEIEKQEVSSKKPNILVIGSARHGKTTVSQILSEEFGLLFKDSTEAICEILIFDRLSKKYGYETIGECYEDRVNKRNEWFEIINDYSSTDGIKLYREVMSNNNIYCGMRESSHIEQCIREGVFDFVIGVYNPRLPLESRDSFNASILDQSDYIIINKGCISELREKVIGVYNQIVKRYKV